MTDTDEASARHTSAGPISEAEAAAAPTATG